MSSQTSIVASRAPDGVKLTMYTRDGNVVIQTTLPWRKAMLLGLNLANLAIGPFFRLEAKEMPAQEDPGRANPPASAGSERD